LAMKWFVGLVAHIVVLAVPFGLFFSHQDFHNV